MEEMVLPRDEPPDWLCDPKWSSLKSCTCHVYAHVWSNRIKEKETRHLRRIEVEDMGRVGGRKGNGEKGYNFIF